MKVILTERVKEQGEKGDVVEVSAGYARNYLIPNNLAKPASDENISEIKQKRKEEKKQENKKHEQAQKRYSRLNGATINLQKPANEDGGLYASVSKEDVVQSIKDFCGIKLRQDQIEFPQEIKSTGSSKVEVALADDSRAELNLNIQPQ
ncbi:MAG: 50S ribosomal protein L9 [Candidatus Magasanikbacteria bacterium]